MDRLNSHTHRQLGIHDLDSRGCDVNATQVVTQSARAFLRQTDCCVTKNYLSMQNYLQATTSSSFVANFQCNHFLNHI